MGNQGRWPANVILSPGMAESLNEQSGVTKSTLRGGDYDTDKAWFGGGKANPNNTHGDSGGASRYFLEAWYEQGELEWIYANGLRPHGA